MPGFGDPAAIPQVKGDGSPWDRWGRLLGGAWVFFIAYPVLAALNAPVAGWLRYGAAGLLVVFAVVYVAFFTSIHLPSTSKSANFQRGSLGLST